jgi:hypothetical protein
MKIGIALFVVVSFFVGGLVTARAASHAAALSTLDYIQENLESLAEGAVTGSLANTVAHRVASDWSTLRPSLSSQGADQAVLKSVDSTISALDTGASHGIDLRVAANDATGAIAPLFGFAGATVPWQFNKIEYLRRAIGLAADAANWERAASATAELTQTWQEFRPRMIAHNAQKEASRFDAALTLIKSAADQRDAKATVRAANDAGDVVDGMETAFGG